MRSASNNQTSKRMHEHHQSPIGGTEYKTARGVRTQPQPVPEAW